MEIVGCSLSTFQSTFLRGNNCFPSRCFYSKMMQSIRVLVLPAEVHACRQYDVKAMDMADAGMKEECIQGAC